MGIFDKIFGKKQQPVEHAVIVNFKYTIDEIDPLLKLGDNFIELIEKSGIGEYDGHEIATDLSDGILYFYGRNAEEIFNAIEPTLKKSSFFKEVKAKLRFGPPEDGVKEIEIEI